MTEKTRYFKIGLFTLIGLVFLGIGLFTFGSGALFERAPLTIETYFSGSVQGLDVGSFVKMSGVSVGKVKEISFVKDIYFRDKKISETQSKAGLVYVKMEIKGKYFSRLENVSEDEKQALIDLMVKENGFRAKLSPIGITGLLFVELGFFDLRETPAPMKLSWNPKDLYIPSAPGVITRLGESFEKMLNKMDSDIYPLMENMSKASADFPAVMAEFKQVMPHITSIAKNIDDITSTGKKYPSQMIFGEAPPKSRYSQ